MPRRKSTKRREKIPEKREFSTEKDEEAEVLKARLESVKDMPEVIGYILRNCLLYTSDAADE